MVGRGLKTSTDKTRVVYTGYNEETGYSGILQPSGLEMFKIKPWETQPDLKVIPVMSRKLN